MDPVSDQGTELQGTDRTGERGSLNMNNGKGICYLFHGFTIIFPCSVISFTFVIG
jgi:hypothetical protein